MPCWTGTSYRPETRKDSVSSYLPISPSYGGEVHGQRARNIDRNRPGGPGGGVGRRGGRPARHRGRHGCWRNRSERGKVLGGLPGCKGGGRRLFEVAEGSGAKTNGPDRRFGAGPQLVHTPEVLNRLAHGTGGGA